MNILPRTLSQLPSKLARSLHFAAPFSPGFLLSSSRSDEERDWHRLCVIRPLSYAVTPAKNSFLLRSAEDRTISSLLPKISRPPSTLTDIGRARSTFQLSVFVLSPLLWFAGGAHAFSSTIIERSLCVINAFFHTYVKYSCLAPGDISFREYLYSDSRRERGKRERGTHLPGLGKLTARLPWEDSKMTVAHAAFIISFYNSTYPLSFVSRGQRGSFKALCRFHFYFLRCHESREKYRHWRIRRKSHAWKALLLFGDLSPAQKKYHSLGV